MFNIISLKVKCPLCSISLMDKDQMVDNEPGIKLNITIGNKGGNIWLSSIYESYNYIADIDIPQNEIAIFHCPHCKKELVSSDICDICDAPMVALHLDTLGDVSICSRAGCKKHLVSFKDLTKAMNYFYDNYSYAYIRPTSGYPPLNPEPVLKLKDDEKEIIKTGSFLSSYCPHCRCSLIEDRMIKFKVESETSEMGYLFLSPYLNIFTHKSTVKLPENHQIKSIRCFHCNEQLFVQDKHCPVCNSEIAKIMVAAMTKMIDFYICSKKGCIWHGLSDEDMQSIVLEDSKDW